MTIQDSESRIAYLMRLYILIQFCCWHLSISTMNILPWTMIAWRETLTSKEAEILGLCDSSINDKTAQLADVMWQIWGEVRKTQSFKGRQMWLNALGQHVGGNGQVTLKWKSMWKSQWTWPDRNIKDSINSELPGGQHINRKTWSILQCPALQRFIFTFVYVFQSRLTQRWTHAGASI